MTDDTVIVADIFNEAFKGKWFILDNKERYGQTDFGYFKFDPFKYLDASTRVTFYNTKIKKFVFGLALNASELFASAILEDKDLILKLENDLKKLEVIEELKS